MVVFVLADAGVTLTQPDTEPPRNTVVFDAWRKASAFCVLSYHPSPSAGAVGVAPTGIFVLA